MITNTTELLLLAMGSAVGAVQVLTGAGGGILALPLLLLGTTMSVQAATPVALMAVAVSAGVATVAGLQAGLVRYRAACMMAIFGWMASPVGVWMAHQVPSNILAMLFAMLMLRNAVAFWMQPAQGAKQNAPCVCLLDENTGRLHWTWPCARALGRTGLTAGLLSGLLGVGGGFIIVPSLAKNTNLPMQSIVVTSLMVICLVALSSIGSTLLVANIAWDAAIPFVAGAVMGGLLMRIPARRISSQTSARAFALLSAAVAVALLVRTVSAYLA
jgi:uncharacterized protein